MTPARLISRPPAYSPSCSARWWWRSWSAAVCAVLSCYLRAQGLVADGRRHLHAVLPGIVVAFLLGLPLRARRVRRRPLLRSRHRLT